MGTRPPSPAPLCAMLAIMLGSCAPDIPTPGTRDARVIEYPRSVLGAHEENELTLELDAVLGVENSGDDSGLLYVPRGLDVDTQGNVYVADSGRNQVLKYAPDGAFLTSFGRHGEGPGEFASLRDIAVVRDRVVVVGHPRRFSVWTADGELEADRALDTRGAVIEIAGTDAGVFVAGISMPPRQSPTPQAPYSILQIVGFDLDGEASRLYAETPRLARVRGTAPAPFPTSISAVAPDGTVFVSDGSRYEVARLGADGVDDWLLRVDWDPLPLGDDFIEQMLGSIRPETRSATSYSWPEVYPNLQHLALDGEGRLYVARFMDFMTRDPDRRPVEVFSAEGEHLLSAVGPAGLWDAAFGDHVYRVEEGPGGDPQVGRYRLVWKVAGTEER